MDHEIHVVYVRTDEQGRITAVMSGEFIADKTGWTAIDEGEGRRYLHAQVYYFPLPIRDERGVFRYKLEEDEVVERTQAEMDADYTPPEIPPTDSERIKALEEQNEMLMGCLLEMSEMVYA